MATLTDSQTLLAFKAGRSFRRGSSSFVDADPTKGAIVLSNGDDGLLHFMWKERPSGNVREDLILFPGDARMERVTQERSGRTFVLRFDSSDQKHFFWMQDAIDARDDELVGNLNRFLADPTAVPIWNAGDGSASQQTSSSSDSAGGSSSGPGSMGSGSATYRAAQAAAPPAGLATAEQLARLRALVTSMGASSTRVGVHVNTGASVDANANEGPGAFGGRSSFTEDDDDISLTDILTPQVILPLITSHPSLLPLLFQHLPPEFVSLMPHSPPQPGDEGDEQPVGDVMSLSSRSPSTSSSSTTSSWIPATADDIASLTETLRRTIHSNPFRQSVAQLDRVLRMGMGAALVRGLGMRAEDGRSVGAFLQAVSEQGKLMVHAEETDSMDQD
ncbi:adhesion regulating molecule [Pisolithus croceorrhizus]|nr:adhesion regulating molecule [Pisolithus croceorrhizus]KAI6124362.1 adhesion regulating molecule [Pisolithus croceorrhizus]